MDKDICFMALGGGQNVGGSSYYMQLGNQNILLDVGVNYNDGIKECPDFISLLCSGKIKNIDEINQVYISHAHQDHNGYLLETMAQCKNTNVFMTNMTKKLTKLQLCDKHNSEGEDLVIKRTLLEKIIDVSYLEKRSFKDYAVTFLTAGHIPGAMMTLFRYKKRNILYTGDCSMDSTLLTDGCMIPKSKIDVLILCGLHAKNSSYIKIKNNIYEKAKEVIFDVAYKKKKVMCVLPQLSKGVEFLKILNEYNHRDVKIYVDNSVLEVVRTLERANIKILDKNCRTTLPLNEKKPHIYITSQKKCMDFNNYDIKNIDFSLHDDYEVMKDFIKKINPEKAIIVHTGEDDGGDTIEQDLLKDPFCRTQIIFPENSEMYYL